MTITKLLAKPGILTLRDAMRAVFPDGYIDFKIYSDQLTAFAEKRKPPARRHVSWTNPPCSAVDLFGLAGSLLVRSGAYHHVSPEVPAVSPRSLTVTDADREAWVAAGREWRGEGALQLPAPPKILITAWRELHKHLDEPVFQSASLAVKSYSWWRAALTLFCIADEAALDIGFEIGGAKSAQAAYVEFPIRASLARSKSQAGAISFSRADRDQVCVLPKSRTPKVGCTIRSLSHNLALLPGRGMARAYWRPAPSAHETEQVSPERPFNVVVLPQPFQIRASAFSGLPAANASWGWFDVDPHWCPRSDPTQAVDGFAAYHEFVEAVLAKAEADVGAVHALVLPEVALSSQVFRLLCESLQHRPEFELLVSGLFDVPAPERHAIRRGNFTGMARFLKSPSGEPSFDVSIREKHHRWRVEKSQITAYALGSALDVNRGWWEHIDILSRSLDVVVLRGGATVTTLICEDLARSDPCQELVRGIGPNFVIALLMDGPQIASRWPARYATVLAEDPGSSVLTLTSLGLIERSNATGRFPPARQIGLFQDDSGTLTEIKLAAGAQAMCLTLQPSTITERTLDGRDDHDGAQSWKLSGVIPVTVDHPNTDVMAGRWPTS